MQHYTTNLRNCPKVRYNLQLNVIRGDYNITDKQIHISIHMHQSISPAPSAAPPPPPPADPRALAFWDGKFPGVGTFGLSNSLGWGREKRTNSLSSVNTATFFIDCAVKQHYFKHFNVRFFVSSNVFLSNSARILTILKTTCTSLWFKY